MIKIPMADYIKKRRILIIIGFVSVMAIAVFFRLWKLDSVPPGLYPDVAINGNDALDALAAKDFKLFYPENNGREGLFMWLIALSFLIFGPSVWAIKIVAAVFGILTVLGLYFLTKELFFKVSGIRSLPIALLAAFFLAISFWHVNFSRIGFRAIMVPFFLVFGFYFLLRGFRCRKTLNFIFSGLFFGLGFYTYIAYRFVIFILGVVLVIKWFGFKKENKKARKQYLLQACFLIFFIFISGLPIAIYFLGHPNDFFGRAGGVSIFGQPNPLLELGKSFFRHLAMFNIRGDSNWRHNFSASPALLWPVGIFFLIGFIICAVRIVKAVRKRDNAELAGYGLMFSWFFFMLASGFLSSEGAPHALRTIGAIPVVYMFCAIGALWLFEKIRPFYKTRFQIAGLGAVIILFFGSIACVQFDKYFLQWAKNSEVKGAFSENYLRIGEHLNSLPDAIQKYVVVNAAGVPVPWPDGLPMPAQTSMFLERAKYGRIRSAYLLPDELNQIKIEKGTIIALLQRDENLIRQLQDLFPDGKLIKQGEVLIYEI